MKRRTKAGGNTVKTQRRKTLGRGNAPKVAPRHSHRATGTETNVEQFTRELAEAREREAATAEHYSSVISPTARAISSRSSMPLCKEYTNRDAQKISGYRSLLGVPLLREGVSMGVLGLTRYEPKTD